ncbi:unnamed protein product [Adineta steineri]|uniref:TUG ubiquitin-like domain-containing protein n=1 Tax=Adineta steineri TaxID=433720 RepID=A0A814AF49_9BILA|nr:unnamed protein product [Adineta steineri]
MSKITINILCPSGHRRKAQLMPNNSLFQVLEDMCNQENLDSSEWALMYQHKKCDLTIPWRLQNIPTNATLEMSKLEDRDIHVMLADICNENGDHENALSNVLKAIDLQETINEQQRYRLLAESYYKLGLIYELINKFTEAVDSFDKAIIALGKAIEQANGDDKESEREELKSLLPAIELKRNDAQASIADKHLIAQARNIITGTNGANNNHTTDNSTAEAPVKDLTLTIRHKRPATESQNTDDENKKAKTEEN